MTRFLLLLLFPLTVSALPLRFEFNQGQFSPKVVFAARGIVLTDSGPVFPHGIRMTFTGARVRRPVAGTPAGSVRYFARELAAGNGTGEIRAATVREQWSPGSDHRSLTVAALFADVRYREIYPGIDLVFHDGAARLEYDFVVAPGADARAIRMRFRGARRVAIDGGELVVDGMRHQQPAVYQEAGGARRYVVASYRLRGGEVSFELGDYDRTLPLIIDPVLTYATYAGGSGAETGNAVAVDTTGNAYLAGGTDSTDFALLKGATSARGYLTKLDPAGAKTLATAVIGGASIDAMAVDASRDVVVTGSITTAAQFPGATPGAYQAGATAYVARFTQDASGFKLGFIATFEGVPSAVALDPSGAIYLTGSANGTFQTTSGAMQTAIGGATDAFVLKLSANGSKAVFATLLGGSNNDTGRSIAVDAAGQAVVSGDTSSANFPTTAGASQTKFGGRSVGDLSDYGDAFVARLDAAGAHLVFSTYLGGTAPDIAYGLALDKDGNAYVTGGTQSANFPVTAGAFQTKYAGGSPLDTPDPAGDAFVAKFSINGSLLWSTFLGGSSRDLAEAAAVDAAGNVYVTGASYSADFPLTAGALRGCRTGGPWVSEFDPSGKLLVSTSTSGMGIDEPHAIAVAGANAVHIGGDTISRVFFASGAAAQRTYGGGDSDAFVAKFDLTGTTKLTVACVLNGASFQPGNFASFPLGTVAPGEFVSIFGIGVGPDQAVIAQPTTGGTYPTALGGTQVFFDGVPAVMLYAGANQVNAIVPYGIKAPVTQMTVQRGGITDGPRALPIAAAVPGIFTANSAGTQQAAVLNQDGSYNSPANPAVVGSVIVFYAVGAGAMMPAMTDGSVSPNELAQLGRPQLPVTVQIRGADAKVLYAGAAPGYVSGLLQVNVEVPVAVGFGNSVPLTLQVGGQASQFNVTIATTTAK